MGRERGQTEIRRIKGGKRVVKGKKTGKNKGHQDRGRKGGARAAGRKRGRENEAIKRERAGERDMQMQHARLRGGRVRNGVGVGYMRGQRDREQRRE